MEITELREQFKSAPDWAYVGLVKRIEALEAAIQELQKPKPVRKKVKNGN